MRTTVRRAVPGVSALLLSVLSAGTVLTACSGGAHGRSPVALRGTVQVLYAGSLVRLMEQDLGPEFTRLSGYRFSGYAGGSKELANEIEGGIRRGDVFVSADPSVDTGLQDPARGAWVSWYADFARSPLVLGYDPHSRFAAELRRRPWYEVVTSAGFLVGRTDPALDPKGALTVEAVRQAARRTGDRALLDVIGTSNDVFPEEAMLGRLEAGQLDAGFLYQVEATAAGLPSVPLFAVPPLSGVPPAATFTVTILERAPHPSAALAFVRFLLGPRARRALQAGGLQLIDPPSVHGTGEPGHLASATSR